MAATIRRVAYFNTTIPDRPGEAYLFLSVLAKEGVSLLSVSAVPFGPNSTQLWIFPESAEDLTAAAARTRVTLTGPQHAFLIQGDDELGVLVGVHEKLSQAHINVYASTGVADGQGHFGYIVYVSEAEFEAAAHALNV